MRTCLLSAANLLIGVVASVPIAAAERAAPVAAQPSGFPPSAVERPAPAPAQPLGFPPVSAQPTGFPPVSGKNAVGVLSCGMDFDVAVRSGPSAGLSLKGDLYFSFDRAGELQGDFTPEGGKAIPVVGQVHGHLIGLVFDFGDAGIVWGTGTGVNPIFGLDCGDVVGGLFAGPADGDIGDWKGKGKPRVHPKE